jgi:hypothetical protein
MINLKGEKMSGRKVTVTSNTEMAQELNAEEALTYSTEETNEKEEVGTVSEQPNKQVEDLDDAEEIWEGGPTAGMIKSWKEQFGEVYVTSITFDKHIVWRVLSRIEYKNLVKKMEQLVQAGQLTSAEANMWNEEAISEMCILYPQYDKIEMNGVMAGIPSLISQEVLEASGFVALEVRQL